LRQGGIERVVSTLDGNQQVDGVFSTNQLIDIFLNTGGMRLGRELLSYPAYCGRCSDMYCAPNFMAISRRNLKRVGKGLLCLVSLSKHGINLLQYWSSEDLRGGTDFSFELFKGRYARFEC